MTDRNADLEPLQEQLRGLGRVLVIPPPPDGLVDAVMTRLEREPAPLAPTRWQRLVAAVAGAGRWWRERWRIATAVVAGALLVLLMVTPAGAAVRQWLGFGAVVVVQEQTPAQTGATAISGTAQSDGTEMTLEQARSAVSFPVGVPGTGSGAAESGAVGPGALGQPAQVLVSDDARAVTMTWPDGALAGSGPIRLDQIGGAPDPFSVKKYYDDVEFTQVRGAEALWLIRPHPIVVLAPDGTEIVESTRQSGPVLVWQRSGVTFRLEGVPDRDLAVAIAESMAR